MYRSTIALLLLLAAVADAQIASLEPSLQLRTVGTVTVPFQNGRPLPSFEKQPRYTMSLAGPWRKMRAATRKEPNGQLFFDVEFQDGGSRKLRRSHFYA